MATKSGTTSIAFVPAVAENPHVTIFDGERKSDSTLATTRTDATVSDRAVSDATDRTRAW